MEDATRTVVQALGIVMRAAGSSSSVMNPGSPRYVAGNLQSHISPILPLTSAIRDSVPSRDSTSKTIPIHLRQR